MKVLGIFGSPRRGGNSEILVKEALAGAAAKGAETRTICLADLTYKACQACMHCRSHEECAEKDGMQEVYRAIAEADRIVIGSPVYMAQMNAQVKALMDRLYRYLNNDFSARTRKETALVFTQGTADTEIYRSYFDHAAKAFGLLGFPVKATVVCGGSNAAGAIAGDKAAMERARRAGENLV